MEVTVTVKVCSFFPKWKVTLYISFLGCVLWQRMMSLRFLWLYARIPRLGKSLEFPPHPPGSQAVARAQFQVRRLYKASGDIYYRLISRVCTWQMPGFVWACWSIFLSQDLFQSRWSLGHLFQHIKGTQPFSTINKNKHLHSWGLESWGLRTRQI